MLVTDDAAQCAERLRRCGVCRCDRGAIVRARAVLVSARAGPSRALAAARGMAAAHVLALKGTGLRSWLCRRVVCVRARARCFARALAGGRAAGARCSRGPRGVCDPGRVLGRAQRRPHRQPAVAGGVKSQVTSVAGRRRAWISARRRRSNVPPQLAPLGEVARLLRVWLQMRGPAADYDDRLAGLGFAWPLFALRRCLPSSGAWARMRALRSGTSMHARALLLVLAMTAGCFVLQAAALVAALHLVALGRRGARPRRASRGAGAGSALAGAGFGARARRAGVRERGGARRGPRQGRGTRGRALAGSSPLAAGSETLALL